MTKIFISAHKPTDYVHDDIFQLVQVGAAQKGKKKLNDAIQDDTGKNISEKNPRFCELTAQYWAWQNQDCDYYGFFHYRRYLSFAENKHPRHDSWGCILEHCIDEDFVKKHKLNSATIERLIKNYDVILPIKKDIRKMPHEGKNMRQQYLSSGYLHAEDLEIMLQVLDEKYPEYTPYAHEYLNGHTSYFNNMFIMKKSLFQDYSKWLFDILLECEKRIDFTDYSIEAIRTPGHLAERLLNIYIAKHQQELKIKELETVAVVHTDPAEDYLPAFAKNNVVIAMSADEFYVPYVATVLTSIRENSAKTNNYDIFVMNKNISPRNQQRLKDIFATHSNFSLRFINISRYEPKFKKLFTRGHFTIETWFRLLLPEILPNYDKILYIDSDLVTTADLAELYNTDIDGYLLAACHDADTAGLYNGANIAGKKDYVDNILKIKKPYEYFQAGVILFNLAEFRKTYTTAEMLKYASSYDFELLDQDVLNNLAQGRVKFVDMDWNVMFDWNDYRIREIINKAPKYLYDEYMAARKAPKIIHYAGPDKPWHQPNSDFAEVFWRYACMTVYYEEILVRTSETRAFGLVQDMKLKMRVRRKTEEVFLPKGSNMREFVKKIYNYVKN